jgi:uncharacterized protein
LKERLASELREAMKARQPVRVGALRMLTAGVKNREVEVGHELSDEEFVEVATREVKRRREAIEAYEKAGRQDRADTEAEEQRVLETYIPASLSDEEVDAAIEEAIAATGASGPGDLGRVMGAVMAKVKGRADGRVVQQKVRDRLTS